MTQSNISLLKSNASYAGEIVEQFKEPQVLRVFRLICFSLIILGSLIGNSVVVRAVLRAKGVKTFTYRMICNLAVAEIISTCCLPFMQTYSELGDWPFSQTLCSLINPLQLMAGMVITTCIAVIAVVRCLLLISFRWYKMTRKTTMALLMSLVIWMLAFICVLPFFLHMTNVSAGNGKQWCLILLPGEKLDNNYPSSRVRFLVIIQFLINYVFPLAITLVSYGIVALKLKLQTQVSVGRRFRAYDNTETQTEAVNMTEITDTSTSVDNRKNKRLPATSNMSQQDDELDEYESDLLKMFYAIVLIFILCYLPYQCFFLQEYVGRLSWNNWEYFDITRTYLYLLTCFPSALHPICYGLMSQFYHKAFVKLILWK